MRKISGLVVVLGAVLLPLSLAHAAEVTQLYSNNYFANAFSTDSAGATTSVGVTREKGHGQVVDTINVTISSADGSSFASVTGILPKGALQITAKKASVDVDFSQIQVTSSEQSGSLTLPSAGLVSVEWTGTGTSRTSGNAKFEDGNQKVNIVGTSTFTTANVTGSVAGTQMVDAFGFLNSARESVIIHISVN